jgi:HTH-like domain
VPRPLKDEFLSSWLWRMASVYCLTPNELLAVWTSEQGAPLPWLSAATVDESPTPEHIVARITAICEEFECYGYRRVGAELRHQGIVVNAKKIRRTATTFARAE